MQYGNSIRSAAVAMVVASAAALLVTGCRSGGDEAGADAPSSAASSPAAGSASPASAAPVPPCTVGELKADAHQAAVRPNGTGIGAAVVGFTNTSGHPCTLQGFPTVAGAGNGSPDRNVPLAVTRTGSASPVALAAGGTAWVKLTFVQVQGEADGYCESGTTPFSYPTLVVGLPGAGAHQVALEDGLFAECDNKVTVTAVSAVQPS
ncbi:hypothetical protein GCM10020367_64390 [Streptomyces sannanensis]|uniref:DUF4232 domain-containing protein n=1 Tax=Streptomyces sannanensis TaxID=285536 RepID=A0ABP6SMG5_9ACTN